MSSSGDKNAVHRPGALKQQNKPFKSGRHRSQHEIKRSTKGFLFYFRFLLKSIKYFQVEWQIKNMHIV